MLKKRSIVYEYADSFDVRRFDDEARAMEKTNDQNLGENIEFIQADPSIRPARRSDVMNLNLRNYNHLIERVEGTLVDIYGNVLDLNRNIIPIPDADTINTSGSAGAELRKIYTFIRRSVKSHYEINSRKETVEPENTDTENNAKNHSRFSIDIDGEGLTKINIPASSDTGNIPILSRNIVSRDDQDKDSGAFRDPNKKDVRVIAFAEGGPAISNTAYVPETISGVVTAGTAHHDVLNIASSIFNSGKHGSGAPMQATVTNEIDGSPNAGGRSMHANLDGSLEMSIGKDTVDGKSMVLDLAGSMISHFGKDGQGRSIIHQSDGDVIIQVGDDQVTGKMEIHMVKGGGKAQKIIIDEGGITIDVDGNALFNASGDMSIVGGGRVLISGGLIALHGSADVAIDGTRAIQGFERIVIRNGNPVMW